MNLQERYNRDTYLGFLRTFVPGFKQDIRAVAAEKLAVTQEAHFLGESEELDLSVFEITHTSSTDARVSLSMDGFKLMKTSATYRALIVYRSENSEDWRFSLMTTTPDLVEKGKVVRKLSNPRRFSFFLGPNAKINTPKRFLIKEGSIRDFADLQGRFSLEVVNKEFYKQISEKFTQLVGGKLGTGKKQKIYEPLMKLPSQAPTSQVNMQFGVRLIGRIIFCWFLREKKSKNNLSLMPAELLSSGAVLKNSYYYHSILEPIFFEVLNKEQRSRREEFSGESYSLIPYLNGGLFSPHEDDYYKRPNGEQSLYHNTLVIPDSWLNELFEILETYNFTIDENTSFDEELSIDPEMLGRIFENLLAEINPETGVSARKSTGSYYTPRVIVDYMVDESLLLYLQEHTKVPEEKLRAVVSYDLSDDAEYKLTEEEKKLVVQSLGKLKLLDPACGSGAFPIGALQKIVFILQQIDPDGKHWLQKQLENAHPEFRRDIEKKFSNRELDFLRKLGIIRKCIFGVDIQPIATEIARLRCFLTLIVDERIDDEAENRGIKPLPNLDFKFVTANSLVGLPKFDDTTQTAMFDNHEKIDELKIIRDQYFNAYGIEREQLKTEFVTAQKKLVDQLVEEHGYIGVVKAKLTQSLTSWEPFTHKSSSWFDPEWMFGLNGFDIVIANPPYVQFQKLDLQLRNILREHANYESQSDLWYFFVYKAFDLLRNNGKLTLIVSNYFLQAGHGGTLRKFITDNLKLVSLTDFVGSHVFENVGIHNLIVIMEKMNAPNYDFAYGKYSSLKQICDNSQDVIIINKSALGKTWSLVNDTDSQLLKKLSQMGKQLSSFCKISNGIKSGEDSVFVFAKNSENTKIEKTLLRGYLKNSNIHRYHIDNPKKVVIYSHSSISLDDYPLFASFILPFKQLLEDKWRLRGESNDYWKLYRPREEVYSSHKQLIITPYRTNKIGFAFNEDYLSGTDTYIILNCSAEITEISLLAILNSRLIRWFYEKIGKRKGDIFEIATSELSRIPIVFPSDQISETLSLNVSNIISILKETDFSQDAVKCSDLHKFETQIDQLVYKLYGLSPEDIEIVEASTKFNPESL